MAATGGPSASAPATPAGGALLGWTALFVVGILLAAAGAGIGLRHLQLEGTTATAVLGLGLLLAGLAVVGWSASRLWRGLAGRRRWWLVPLSVVAVVASWSVLIAVMATVVPATPLDRNAAATVPVALREVHPVTDDGVALSAWWAPPTTGPTVVLLHGAGENRAATASAAAVLALHGYGVLLLDARGHGDSAGAGMDLGWYGDSDVAAAIGFLRADGTADLRRVGLLGLSMGGEEAIGAAASIPEVRAVVAEGASARTAEDKDAWLPGGVAGSVQRVVDGLTYGLVDVMTPAGPPVPLRDAVRSATGTRFLLIAAGTSPDEQAAAEAVRAAAPDRVSVWVVPGASHTGALRTEPAAWEDRVVAFFDAALAAQPTPTG